MSLDSNDRRTLLDAARTSIDHGLIERRPRAFDPIEFSPALQARGASFVTLHIEGALRGCIGSLEATQPLIVDVAHNAFQAAFHDPRFGPVNRAESDRLDVSLSILNPAQPMMVRDEADLLIQLRPGVDGLTLHSAGRRATFLPAVWETIGDPRMFVTQLKLKAGLDPDAWPIDLRVEHYTTEHIP